MASLSIAGKRWEYLPYTEGGHRCGKPQHRREEMECAYLQETARRHTSTSPRYYVNLAEILCEPRRETMSTSPRDYVNCDLGVLRAPVGATQRVVRRVSDHELDRGFQEFTRRGLLAVLQRGAPATLGRWDYTPRPSRGTAAEKCPPS